MPQGLQYDYLQSKVRKGPCFAFSRSYAGQQHLRVLYLEALNHRLGREKDSGG